MKKLMLAAAALTGVLLSPITSATIIGGAITGGDALTQGGSFIDLGNAPSGLVVGNDTMQNPNLYGFNEDQNIFLAADLPVDVGASLSIAAGQEVASHYIFFDPQNLISVEGWVDFDSEILGIITSRDNLSNSDFLLNNNVTYLNPGLRGLEPNQDAAWIDPVNSNRLGVSFVASTPGDYIRVITARSPQADVPVPATLSLMLLGMMLLRRKVR